MRLEPLPFRVDPRATEETVRRRARLRLAIDGKPIVDLGLDQTLIQAEVILSDEKADTCIVTFDNIFHGVGDDALFKEGVTLDIGIGYDTSEIQDQGTFVVKRPMEVFGQGRPVVELHGFGKEILLGDSEKRRMWFERTDSDIAESIASEYSLDTDIKPTGRTYERIAQVNQTDWEFLRKRALLYNYVTYIREDKLHFHPARTLATDATVYYRQGDASNVRWLKVRTETFRVAPEVKRQTFDPISGKKVFLSSAALKDSITVEEEREEDLDVRTSGTISQRPVRFQVGGGHRRDEQEVRKQLDALGQSQAYVVVLEADLVGREEFIPGQTIQVIGIGKHSGRYYLKEVHHSYHTRRHDIPFITRILALRQFVRMEHRGLVSELLDPAQGSSPEVGGVDDVTQELRFVEVGQ